MNRSTIAAITATAAATLAIGAGALPASAATQASVPPNPACTARQLHLTLGHERVNTGHISWTLTARDDGPACTLTGFPRLGLLDGHRNPLPEVTAVSGKAHSVLVLNGLTAHLTLSFGSDGMTGERASYLKAGGDVVSFPGGPALVYGGHLTETSWVLPARQ